MNVSGMFRNQKIILKNVIKTRNLTLQKEPPKLKTEAGKKLPQSRPGPGGRGWARGLRLFLPPTPHRQVTDEAT